MTVTAAPVNVRPRSERLRGPLLSAAALAAASVALHLRDPHVSHSWGVCPLYALTGIYCPGCGGLRAVNDLTHGQIGAAASSNILSVALLPLLVFLLGRWAYERWTGRVRQPDLRLTRAFLVSLGVAAVVFTVLRNLAVGAWLAP
jgi:hypothetical protein